jgi:SAM-dependent methyltransferase
LTHPNFTFYQGDFFELEFPEAPFDVIVAVSAVEHVGLGAYGEDMRKENSDRKVLEAFYHLLRPEGQVILTVPFGRPKITPRYRIYDMEALGALLQGYDIDRQEYYRRFDNAVWLPVSDSELGDVDWDPAAMRTGAGGVACIAARRPRDVSQSGEGPSG